MSRVPETALSQSAEFSRSARELREFLDYELAKRNYPPPNTEWYTHPIHKTIPDRPKVTFSETPVVGVKRPNTAKARTTARTMTNGNISTSTKKTRPSSAKLTAKKSSQGPVFHKSSLEVSGTKLPNPALHRLDRFTSASADQFFPVTLSSEEIMGALRAPAAGDCPEQEGLPGPVEAWRPGAEERSRRVATSKSMDEIDKLHAMMDDMPVTATATVALGTPFQESLAKLRMERLRIEESHLLEVKRLEELERIRGPKPKWYELKSPDFHYEAHKNTSLIKEKDYQALYDYRMRLIGASGDHQRKVEVDSFH